MLDECLSSIYSALDAIRVIGASGKVPEGEKAIMNKRTLSAIAIVCAFGWVAPSQAAEQDETARWIDQKPEFVLVKVADKEGHVVGSFHKTGIEMRNGETAMRVVGGTFDYVNWAGPLVGYTVLSYSDGSTVTQEWEGNAKFAEDKSRFYEGTYRCAGGTGRFRGVVCEGTWRETAEQNGMGVGEFSGKMTLPN